ncbi:MAG: hypothetical protein ACP5VN_04085 [Acidobacteriota bacterium]
MGPFLGVFLDGVSFSQALGAAVAPCVPEVLSVDPWPGLLYRRPPAHLLSWLSRRERRRPLLGLTATPLQEGESPVRGFGWEGKGVAVVSTWGLGPEALRGVLRHELGHALGLPHCPDRSCVLAFRSGGQAAGRGEEFCPSCAGLFASALAAGFP